jgi:hypothetical protein
MDEQRHDSPYTSVALESSKFLLKKVKEKVMDMQCNNATMQHDALRIFLQQLTA